MMYDFNLGTRFRECELQTHLNTLMNAIDCSIIQMGIIIYFFFKFNLFVCIQCFEKIIVIMLGINYKIITVPIYSIRPQGTIELKGEIF